MRPLILTPSWLLLAWLAIVPGANANAPVIAVLYPAVGQPYRTVFEDIVTGIQQGLGAVRLHRYVLDEPPDLDALQRWLERLAPAAVITLGRRAVQAFDTSKAAIPQVIGALDASPQTRPRATGISLAVEPALLFETLRWLLPGVETVYVVFDPDRDQWLIDRAQAAAARYRLHLQPLVAADLRTAARQFWHILTTADPHTEAVWLTMDSRLIDAEAVLPVIIEQSWRRQLPAFSSNLMHVHLGVLFALYPDNQALGNELAKRALRVAKGPDPATGIGPLRAVKRALNLRVSSHLNLSIDRHTERQFDLVLQPR